MEVVYSLNRVPIRLTAERWHHVVANKPYMAPILGVTFRLSADTPLYGASLLGAFGIGHCAVIAVAGTSAGAVRQYLNWGVKSRGPALMRKACGVLLLVGGLYILYLAP